MISVGMSAKGSRPVEKTFFSTGWTHRPKGLDKRCDSGFPVVHTPYDFYERI